jgi:NAD(P)-dependent dehydrogenase (short-subunit alcohol dehydrogenase family)
VCFQKNQIQERTMTTLPFRSKTALVTGAGTGIGAATAVLLAARGAKLVLVGRRKAELEDVAAQIAGAGGEALVVAGDVSDPQTAALAVQQAISHFGGLQLAVNNAGIDGGTFKLADISVEDWNHTIGVNLSGVFYGLKFQIPAILAHGGGAIVNISSVYADRGLRHHGAYAASKHGVHGLTRTAAQDYAADPIRINELMPGVIDTPMLDTNRGQVAQIAAFIPAQRIGQPEEVARTACFLLSDEAAYITGSRISVDGGFLT